MNSTRLGYFLTVRETGSIRRAAEILHLSPAALSKAIKLFEAELDLRLIIPSGRGIAITDEGKELARLGKPLFDGLDQLARSLRDKKHLSFKARPIRLGSFEVFTTYFMKELLSILSTESELVLREVIPGEMEKAL